MTTKREIKSDKAFEKTLKDHIVNKSRRTVCLSIRGTQVVFSGEENSVILAKDNMEDMTVADLVQAMKAMDDEPEGLRYKTTETVVFPPMKVKFKGRRWNIQAAREHLTIYLNILGFGKGGTRKYKEPTDEPDGWPDEHAFVTFEHPAYSKLDMANDIIESLLHHHGIDARSHPYVGQEPKTPPPKTKKRKRKVQEEEEEEEEADPNDNSIREDDLVVEEDLLVGEKDDLSEYEKLRERNIAELQQFRAQNGILPHSKISKA
jgi:hypothetical protein